MKIFYMHIEPTYKVMCMDTEEINIIEKFNKSVEKLFVKICEALQPVVDSLLELFNDKTIDAKDLELV